MSDDQPLASKIAAWLGQQGHPLEMVVAAAFRRAGFTVIQSSYFRDPERDKPREIDVVAFRQWTAGEVHWQLTFVVECKLSKQPWVLFTLPTPPDYKAVGYQYYRLRATKLGRQFLSQIRRRVDRTRLPAFEVADRLAYGVRQALGGNPDEPFEATAKIAKAAAALAAADDVAQGGDDDPSAHVVLPVVVLDTKLFEAFLSEASQLVVGELTTGVLDWSNPVAGSEATWIRLVTPDALDAMVADAKATAEYLEHGCTEIATQLGERWWRGRERSRSA